jgi:hypothetical protein
MFTEAFYSTIKGIHLALEVKTSFGKSTPTTGSSTESSSQKPGVPTDNHHQHHQKEEKENLHTQNYKGKLERLRSAKLAHHDQAVKLLDMQQLILNTFKPTTVNFKYF